MMMMKQELKAGQRERLGVVLLEGMMGKRRLARGHQSAASEHWRMYVADSVAESLKLDATLFLLESKGRGDAEAQLIIRLSLTGPQGLKKSWDVVRTCGEFVTFEKKLLNAGLHCDKLPQLYDLRDEQLLKPLSRWLKNTLRYWQREGRWGNLVLFRRKFDTAQVAAIAQEMEAFIFDATAAGKSGFEDLFTNGSGSFSSALKRVESLRNRVVSVKRRDTDIYMESQRLEILNEEETLPVGRSRQHAKSSEKIFWRRQNVKKGDTQSLEQSPLRRARRRGKVSAVPLEPVLADTFQQAQIDPLCVGGGPTASDLEESPTSTMVPDSPSSQGPEKIAMPPPPLERNNTAPGITVVYPFPAQTQKVKRCSSFGVYPTPGNPISRMRKESDISCSSKKTGRHRRNGSDASMFSCGSDMFHFRFSKKTPAGSCAGFDETSSWGNYENDYDEYDEFDEDDSYYDEDEIFDDDYFDLEHGFVERDPPSSTRGEIAEAFVQTDMPCLAMKMDSESVPGAVVYFASNSANHVSNWTKPFFATVNLSVSHAGSQMNTIQDMGELNPKLLSPDLGKTESQLEVSVLQGAEELLDECCSPISVPDDEALLEEFMAESTHATSQLLHSVALHLATFSCTQ